MATFEVEGTYEERAEALLRSFSEEVFSGLLWHDGDIRESVHKQVFVENNYGYGREVEQPIIDQIFEDDAWREYFTNQLIKTGFALLDDRVRDALEEIGAEHE